MRGFIHFSLFAMIVCVLILPFQVHAENRALLVGVGKYQAPGNNLPGIDLDINLMKQMAGHLGFKSSQIKVLRDSEATLAGIEQAIRSWLVSGVGADDRVLFYFSGHGSFIPDQNNDESDKADEVLLPTDMRIAGRTLENTLVDDNFGKLLRAIPSKNVFVFIDACHSGTSTKSLDSDWEEKPKFFKYPGMPNVEKGSFAVRESSGSDNFAALSACQDNETAIATSKGSLFTRGILNAIEKAAESGRSATLKELKSHATVFIRNNVKNPKNAHRPEASGNPAMMTKNIFIPGSNSAPPREPNGVWAKIEKIADHADYSVPLQPNKNRFKVGDPLVITCKIERNGYLIIVNVSPGDQRATVLYPNKYHPDNGVSAGSTVTIPGPGDQFSLEATPPYGESMIVAFLTAKKINIYKSVNGGSGDLFELLSDTDYMELKAATRGFTAKPVDKQLGAGKVITRIEK